MSDSQERKIDRAIMERIASSLERAATALEKFAIGIPELDLDALAAETAVDTELDCPHLAKQFVMHNTNGTTQYWCPDCQSTVNAKSEIIQQAEGIANE